MTIYWTSTKSNPDLFRSILTPEIKAHLQDIVGVDPAIISAELHISTPHVMALQRRLGLRKITGHVRK